MKRALSDMQLDAEVEHQLLKAFMQTADHMRNKPEYDAEHAGLKIMDPKS
jgi:truncated hemoglobin YjbI